MKFRDMMERKQNTLQVVSGPVDSSKAGGFVSVFPQWSLVVLKSKTVGLVAIIADEEYRHATEAEYPEATIYNVNEMSLLIDQCKDLQGDVLDKHVHMVNEVKRMGGRIVSPEVAARLTS